MPYYFVNLKKNMTHLDSINILFMKLLLLKITSKNAMCYFKFKMLKRITIEKKYTYESVKQNKNVTDMKGKKKNNQVKVQWEP